MIVEMNSAQFIRASVKRLSIGFTMIELLIVITILGVLAVAVLSAINPIEQINRGRDTGSQSDAEQLLSAIERYQSTQELWPWQTSATSVVPVSWKKVATSTWNDDGAGAAAQSVLTKLSGGTEEVKKGFVTRLDNSPVSLYVYSKGTTGDSVYICWKNRSNSFNQKAQTRCKGTGTAPSGLPADLQTEIGSSGGVDLCLLNNEYTCLP